MSESEAVGAYRAATIVRLNELRETMTSQIEKIIPDEDSYDRTCTVLALQKVQDLWRLTMSDFEISVGHTLPEIQVQSLLKEKERLNSRLNHLFETTESLYRLILGPLPPEVRDDMTLVTRLNVECKHLRRRLVENQHKLLVQSKDLDVEHISLKQLWKIAQNALETAARAKAFGTHNNNDTSMESSSPKKIAANNTTKKNNNENSQTHNNEEEEEGEMTLDDYKRELGVSREIYDLRLALKKKEESYRDLETHSRASEASLKTRIAEMKARFLHEIDKVKVKNAKYLRKLDQLHEEELKSLVTQVLAALGVSDPVAVEERIEETLSNLREKRERALDAIIQSSNNNEEIIIDSDEEVLGDEEDASHGDQPPSPTQRSLAATYRPGGVHKWEGQTVEGLRKQLGEEKKQNNINQANFMVQVKAKTLEWQTHLQEMQQKYEAEKLGLSSSLLREKGRVTALQKQVDDLTKESHLMSKNLLTVRQQLDDSVVENAQSTRIAIVSAKRDAETRIKEISDDLTEKKHKIETLQRKLQEYSVRFGNKGVSMNNGGVPYCRDIWMQTDPVDIFDIKDHHDDENDTNNRHHSSDDDNEISSSSRQRHHREGMEDSRVKSVRNNFKKGVNRAGMLSRLGNNTSHNSNNQMAHSAIEFNVDEVVIPDTSRVSREENPNLALTGRSPQENSIADHHQNTNYGSNLSLKSVGRSGYQTNDSIVGGVGKSQRMWDGVLNASKSVNNNNNNNVDDEYDDNDFETDDHDNGNRNESPRNHHHRSPSKRGNNKKATTSGHNKTSKSSNSNNKVTIDNNNNDDEISQTAEQQHSFKPLGSMKKGNSSSSTNKKLMNNNTNNNNINSSSTRQRQSTNKKTTNSKISANGEHPGDENLDQDEEDIFEDDIEEDIEENVPGERRASATPPKRESNKNDNNNRRRSNLNNGENHQHNNTNKKFLYPSPSFRVDEQAKSNDQLLRVNSRQMTPLDIKNIDDNYEQQGDGISNSNNDNNHQRRSSASPSPHHHNQQRQQVMIEINPNRGNEEADEAEREEAEEYRRELESFQDRERQASEENRKKTKSAMELLATQGPITVNDSLLTPESVRKTLEVFNTPSYNDAERMKALVVTSTMKPVAVGALPTSVSEKRFFLALARVASFCDTVLVLPRNALPYSVRLQQQLTALGFAKPPEDWKMMKRISPIEICVISTYIGTNFSRRSERMQLLVRQIASSRNSISGNNNNSSNNNLGPNVNSPSGHHAQSVRMEKLENIFAHANSVVSKVRSADMSDNLKDVTWDELHRWQQIDSMDRSTANNNNSSMMGGGGGGASSSSSSQHSPGNKSSGSHKNVLIFPARDASQLLIQILELLRLWNAQKKQLIDQFATHSRTPSLFDKSFSKFGQDDNDDENNNNDQEGDGEYDQDGNHHLDGNYLHDESSSLAMNKRGSSIFRPDQNTDNGQRQRGVAPSSSVLMASGFGSSHNNNQSPVPPPMSAYNGNNNHNPNGGQLMAISARVRNPRSIRQLIAASNTLVRSARRHVEAQRQASQRGESPQFTQDSVMDLRVVGNKNN